MQIEPIIFKVQQVLKNVLAADKHYLLAVSGGADSLALAHACAALQKQGWGTYSVCHVEHGLRGDEALEDMRLVRQFCKEHGLPFYMRYVDVRALARREQLSLEAAARKLRYNALRITAERTAASAIVTAHHMGDQAETLLLRLLRGSGLDGLAAMRLQTEDILRPLLDVKREELEAYCAAAKLHYATDSTNFDTAFTRNRIRHELLPQLAKDYNPDIVPTLARTAKLLAIDADFMEALSTAFFDGLVRKQEGEEQGLSLSLEWLSGLQQAMRLRVLRKAYYSLSDIELDYERTLALENLCERKIGGKIIQLPGKVTALCKNKQIIFTKQKA